MKGLNRKIAIVTGGAASIGEAVTRALHGAGVEVVIAARSANVGEALAGELGSGAIFHRTDISRDEDLDALVARAVKEFGGLDILVNVAAVYVDKGPDSSRQDWLDTFNVNVFGHALLVQKARPHLAKRKGASIVNFGSISAKVAQANRWTYPVSKAAIHQMTRNMALDLAVDGIRVNTVMAGITWSAPVAGLTGNDRELADRVCADYQFLGRAGDPEEVAGAVLYLCSDHASFVTGTELRVDGGYSALGPEARVSVMETMMKAVEAANLND